MTDLAASVTLPPEILDKILEHIPANGDGRPTLIACALVATWWTGPSQRRLFSYVSIHGGNHQRWMSGVVLPGSKTHLLEYVRSLWHCRDAYTTIYQMQDLPQDSGKYLSALHNVHTLTLWNTKVEYVSEGGFSTYFSAFRETLTDLSLEIFSTSFSTFVTLVDFFPNITALQLHSLTLEPDEGPVPTLSRPLRGKAHLRDIPPEFFNRFAKLDLEYEELVINSSRTEVSRLEGAFQISANTVKFLRLTAAPQFEVSVSIHDFRQLRGLELVLTWPRPTLKTLLSSITSIELRKVIFLVGFVVEAPFPAQGKGAWGLIDEQLCGLVDRLRTMGYCRALEAELRFTKMRDDPGKYQFAKFLPRFREKGIVAIIDVVHGHQLLHCSTRSH